MTFTVTAWTEADSELLDARILEPDMQSFVSFFAGKEATK